jgi:serine/threonine protein kinase/tetratricopeptide (TPR) repeat protein
VRVASGTRFGPYEILALLGSGGMGDVYRARDTRLLRDVAIKILNPATAPDADLRRRFDREARAIATLNHPHIAALYDIGEEREIQYLVMEYVVGDTLAAHLRSGPLAIDESLRFGIQIADALAAAHREGIIHRDVKPSNVIITSNGAKLLDFGLARPVDVVGEPATTAMTSHCLMSGTVQYMAPEQLLGRPLDVRTDIFALGSVLYEALAGRKAFPGSTQPDVIGAILHLPPAPLSELRPSVPASLEGIVHRCLTKDPVRRWPTADLLLAELRRVKVPAAQPRGGSGQKRSSHTRSALAPPRTGLRSRGVVVLPLKNLSGDPQQEYFVDGMTESLITSLAKAGGFKVISRASAMSYKGTQKPLRTIAEELKVDSVLEGSLMRMANRIRMTLQLVRVSTDSPIWANSYSRDVVDVLEIQDEVADVVATAVKGAMTPTDRRASVTAPRRVVREAHDAYLRGQYHLAIQTSDALRKAFEAFRTAVAIDPTHALSHIGLARYYVAAALFRLMPYADAYAEGWRAAERALTLDPALASAHSILGSIAMYRWQFVEAERAFTRALELDSNDVVTHTEFAKYLSSRGRHEEAIEQIQIAEELDPRAPGPMTEAALVFYTARRFDEAVKEADRAIEMSPAPPAQYARSLALAQLQRYAEAFEGMKRAAVDVHPSTTAGLILVLARTGRLDDATLMLTQLLDAHQGGLATDYDVAEAYAGLNDADHALRHLQAACRQRLPEMIGIAVDPIFDGIRRIGGYQDLLREIGLNPH